MKKAFFAVLLLLIACSAFAGKKKKTPPPGLYQGVTVGCNCSQPTNIQIGAAVFVRATQYPQYCWWYVVPHNPNKVQQGTAWYVVPNSPNKVQQGTAVVPNSIMLPLPLLSNAEESKLPSSAADKAK